MKRVGADVDIPAPSEFGPRELPIPISDEATARLDQWLKAKDEQRFKEQSQLEQMRRERRASFLTEFRANLEPIERRREQADNGATDFALLGVKSCYFLNAGGLVVLPAILQALSGDSAIAISLLWPSIIFSVGILFAVLTNYLGYRSLWLAGEMWGCESSARAREVSSLHYPPEDQEEHDKKISQDRVDYEKKNRSANRCANSGVITFGLSMLCFVAGVGVTIYMLSCVTAI